MAELKNGRLAMIAFSGPPLCPPRPPPPAPPPSPRLRTPAPFLATPAHARAPPPHAAARAAAAGMIHQTFVTGKPLFASLNDIFSSP